MVWSEPLRTLSAHFGISDVALKETCTRAEIPTPDRGYWLRRRSERNHFEQHHLSVGQAWTMKSSLQAVVSIGLD